MPTGHYPHPKFNQERKEKASIAMKLAYAEGRHAPTPPEHGKRIGKAWKKWAESNPEKFSEIRRAVGDKMKGRPQPPGLTGACTEHWKAKEWAFITPDNVLITGRNLNQLIRDNSHLFAPQDVIWKGSHCRASVGLNALYGKTSRSWKGWIIGHKPLKQSA